MRVMLIAFLLAGCATNSIRVEEITAEGASLVVEQKTVSMIGAKTEEGTGSFNYEATSPDDSGFSMHAGASVIGQESPEFLTQAFQSFLYLYSIFGTGAVGNDNELRSLLKELPLQSR